MFNVVTDDKRFWDGGPIYAKRSGEASEEGDMGKYICFIIVILIIIIFLLLLSPLLLYGHLYSAFHT